MNDSDKTSPHPRVDARANEQLARMKAVCFLFLHLKHDIGAKGC